MMLEKSRSKPLLLLVITLFAAQGCTMTLRRTTVRFEDDPATVKQAKEGVVIQNLRVKEFPPSFYADLQACRPGTTELDPGFLGSAPMERIMLAGGGQLWFKLAVTNDSDHVLRLERAVFKLKDPKGVMHDQIGGTEIYMELSQKRPCPTTAQMLPLISALKMLEHKTELLPKTTEEFWIVFKPSDLLIPGTWSLSIFDVPVKVDQAGNPIKTTRFDFKSTAQLIAETVNRTINGKETILSSEPVK